MTKVRVIIADDERPARAFLSGILREFEDVEVIGDAPGGAECVEMIEQLRPDLALIDLQMPEVDGLGVVRLVRKDRLPLVAFVTAFDEYAVRAFEMNAIDYLLKPVDAVRLRGTVNRAIERLERAELRPGDADRIRAAATEYAASMPPALLRRIPVRKRDDIYLVPVEQIVSIIADGEPAASADAPERALHDHLSPQGHRGAAGSGAVRSDLPRDAAQHRRDSADHAHAGRHVPRCHA